MRLILLGPPGAGKGTQASSIAEKYQVEHISTGDIFRYHIKNNTELGEKVKEYTDNGKLVPDELTCEIVWERLDREDCQKGFLLDGFPRTLQQAEILEQGLKERGQALDSVISIEVPNEILLERLSGRRVCNSCGEPYHTKNKSPKVEGVCDTCGGEIVQRKDDLEATVRNRIQVYEEQTAPLIDYYKERDLLLSVDGTKAIEVVREEIFATLASFSSKDC